MAPQKTIAFFNTNPAWGGGEKWHLDVALRLKEKGHRVVFFVGNNSELLAKVREHNLPHESVGINNYSFVNPFKIHRVSRMLERYRPEAVILNLPSDAKVAGVAARKAGVGKIIYRRGTALPVHNNFFNRKLFRRVVTDVVTNSEATKKLLLERNPHLVDPQKIHVIYNGIDFDAFDRRPVQPIYHKQNGELVLGNAGRFVEQKGHGYLLEVARKLRQADIPFKILLAGEGKLEKSIRKEVQQEGLDQHIRFTGFISDIKSFMHSIDLFLLTSLWEGFGYVIVEAMASSKPVMAFNISSNPELIRNGENGFLVPFEDTQSLTDQIIRLYHDQNLREKMGRQARHFVEKKFDIARTVQALEKIIETKQ